MNEEKAMKAKDIEVIIRACAESGVRQLQYQGLTISFEPIEKEISYYSQPDSDQWSQEEFKRPPEATSQAPDEAELDLLAVTNPLAWEELSNKA